MLPKPKPHPLLPLALIFLSTLLAYLPIYSAGFIWDDPDYIINNANLRTAAGLWQTWSNPTSLPQYYPLVHTTFWLEYQLWALWAPGYHLVNVLLHALGAYLLFRLLRRIGLTHTPSLLAALLWSLHPVQVESVAWITERKNTLSAVFYFASFLQLLTWHQRQRARNLLAAFVLFAAALASKSVTASLPAAFLLVLYWQHLQRTPAASASPHATGIPPVPSDPHPSNPPTTKSSSTPSPPRGTGILPVNPNPPPASTRPAPPVAGASRPCVPPLWPKLLLSLLPFFALGLLSGLFTAHLERTHVSATGPEWSFSPPTRLLIAGKASLFYLQKLALPTNLAFIYPRWTLNPSDAAQYLFPAAALTLLLTLFALRKRPWAAASFTAYAFFLGTLFPALGFFNIYPQRYSFVADHFQHLASIGPLLLLAYALTRLPRPIARPTQIALLTLLAALTLNQSRIYHDPLTLWTDTQRKNPTSWMVQVNLGLTHDALAKAATTPTDRATHDNLAYSHMLQAATLGPTIPDALWNAGVAHANRDQFPEAEQLFQRAIQIDPTYAMAFNSYGLMELRRQNLPHARQLLQRALELQIKFPQAHANYAQLLETEGQLEQAAHEYAAALSLDPTQPRWRAALAKLVARLALNEKDPPKRTSLLGDAFAQYTLAINADPTNPHPRWELAHLLRLAGREDLATPLFTQAYQLNPTLRTTPTPFPQPPP